MTSPDAKQRILITLQTLTPPKERYPDQWADEHRIIPKGHAEPGRWKSSRVPHMTPIGRSIHDGVYSTICAVMGSQMGKTETMANIMGHRLDDNPVPMMYVAPTMAFANSTFEPKFRQMVEQSPTLRLKKPPGVQENKAFKFIAGVKVRFAWAGSPTELAGDSACKVFVDERDRMKDLKREGDPVTLATARHSTYADGQTIVFSTPTVGNTETEVVKGFEFWKQFDGADTDDNLFSPTWKIFEQGTMRHWAVPCPHCNEYFIPRFKQLQWPHGADGHSCTPTEAFTKAQLACFVCGTLINQQCKDGMNSKGRYVAPGQEVNAEGIVSGDLPDRTTDSYWVSGLMSPWVTWGDTARDFLQAARDKDPSKIQSVLNTRCGELYAIAGDAPSSNQVESLKVPYKLGTVPAGVMKIVMGVDVQANRLVYVIRGFGVGAESWLIEYGEMLGETNKEEVWKQLGEYRTYQEGGIPISRVFIDSGFHTHEVYDFCRKYRHWAFAIKGKDTIRDQPLTMTRVEVTTTGKSTGLPLYLVHTDHFKTLIYERIALDIDQPGAFHIPEDTPEQYCYELISERRVAKPSGAAIWIQMQKDNHALDAECYAWAAAWGVGALRIRKPVIQTPTDDKSSKIEFVPSDNNPGGASWFRKN